MIRNLPAKAGDVKDVGSILKLGRFPGGGNGNPLQYSFWRIPWIEEPGGLQSMGCKEVDMTEHTQPTQISTISTSGKAGLKLSIQKTKIMASSTINLWQIERGKVAVTSLFSWASKSPWTVTTAMKLRCSLEEKLRWTESRQHIKKAEMPLCWQRSI